MTDRLRWLLQEHPVAATSALIAALLTQAVLCALGVGDWLAPGVAS